MPIIHNIKDVQRRMDAWARKKHKDYSVSVIVGYTAKYALIVHERASTRSGQPKYLESPARQYRKEIASVAVKTAEATGSLEKGLVMGGLLLQRESQKIVPVDTGNLKASAFTKVEK